MRLIEALLDRLATLSATFAGIIMMAMTLQISLDVMLKFLLNMPIPATLEMVSSYYMVSLVFLPLGIVTRDEEHLEVELFTQTLPERTLAWFKAFGCLVGIVYAGLMTVMGFNSALYKTGLREIWETATFNMEVWPSRWLYPFGTALIVLYLILFLAHYLRFAATGKALVTRTRPHHGPEATAETGAQTSETF